LRPFAKLRDGIQSLFTVKRWTMCSTWQSKMIATVVMGDLACHRKPDCLNAIRYRLCRWRYKHLL